jgi:hypothetical protein
MSDQALLKVLGDGLTPSDWYALLNRRVFFWVAEERLVTLLGARAYRGRSQTVLTLDTAALLARHMARVTLSPINSGATLFKAQPRGHDTFLTPDAYPFALWERKRGPHNVVVELAVEHSVADAPDFVLRVEERRSGRPATVLWERSPGVP